MATVILVLTLAVPIVVVALLWLAARHHRKTWGVKPGVMESETDYEPKIWLGQQRS
jgi:hypothetical protein